MAHISPCVTPATNHVEDYQVQLTRVTGFASRLHIDLMDGVFASPQTLEVTDVSWPEHIQVDIHLMYSDPIQYMETIQSLGPNLVIVHAEAQGHVDQFMKHMQHCGIRAGVALLQETSVESVRYLVEIADHVLIFSGNLGRFGGTADMDLLAKVSQIRHIKPTIEIGWDGGANPDNVLQIAQAGVDVINVGGAIQKALYPEDVYRGLIHRLAEADLLS